MVPGLKILLWFALHHHLCGSHQVGYILARMNQKQGTTQGCKQTPPPPLPPPHTHTLEAQQEYHFGLYFIFILCQALIIEIQS